MEWVVGLGQELHGSVLTHILYSRWGQYLLVLICPYWRTNASTVMLAYILGWAHNLFIVVYFLVGIS